MVAAHHNVMDLLELISFIRKMRKEDYDRILVIPIKKSDKVFVRTWKHTSAIKSHPKKIKEK